MDIYLTCDIRRKQNHLKLAAACDIFLIIQPTQEMSRKRRKTDTRSIVFREIHYDNVVSCEKGFEVVLAASMGK